jgi:hypothetical protein
MRNHALSRGRLLVVCVLGALASVVPTASADTTSPLWTCRASAAYVEVPSLLGETRVEPILANGFPKRDPNADTGQCARAQAGAEDVNLLPATEGPLAPLVHLTGAFATTDITPEIGDARDQSVSANGGVTNSLTITLGGLTITADTVNASASASCVGEDPATRTPLLSGTSEIVNLRINGTPIDLLTDQSVLDLLLVRVTFNDQQTTGTAASADQSLTRRAVKIELLPNLTGGDPLATVVLGEAKVDRHGAVCAPPPPVPVCPPNTVAQQGNPLLCVVVLTRCLTDQGPSDTSLGTPPGCVVQCPEGTSADPGQPCVRTVTNTVDVPTPVPCPAGSVADPNRGGACVVTVQAPPANCPSATTRDVATNNCVLIRDRPCPEGATADPATRVCVATKVNNIGSGENGRVGSPTGPVATCGRLEMHFVRGMRNLGTSFTSRFGNRTVTRGRLVTCGADPKPIIGARIDVVHVLPGNKRRRKTGLRTRAQGKSTLILPIDLRTRNIEFAYRPDLRSTRVTSRVTLHLTVKNRAGRTLR